MRVALRSPERLRSLILIDTAGAPQPGSGGFFRIGVDIVRTQGMQALYELIGPYMGSGQHGDRIRSRVQTKLGQMDPQAFLAFGQELQDYPSMLDDLKKLDIPTTVIVGANDVGLRQGADELAGTLPGAHLVVIRDAGHSPQDDQPQQWLAAVEHHLACAG